MSDWVWFIAYDHGDARIVLADRDAVGSICDAVGGTALNASWPWKVGIGRPLHRAGEALLGIAERRMRTVAEISVGGDLLDVLGRQGLIDRDDEDSPEDTRTGVSAEGDDQ